MHWASVDLHDPGAIISLNSTRVNEDMDGKGTPEMTTPRPHDRGGWPTDEPIDLGEHQWHDWERNTSVMPGLLKSKGIMVTDELRRGIEALPPDEYERLNYFERWSASLETLLVEKGYITTEEIDQKVQDLETRWEKSES
jgi:nitrile hydratase subunit beta